MSEKPVYYAAVYGDAEDNTHTMVIDESEGAGEGYDVVYVDADNDNRLDETRERFEFPLGTTRHTDPLRIRLLVAAGGARVPYYVNFSAFPYTDDNHSVENIHANLRNSSYYEGEADLFGERRKIAISDLDSNGLFHDAEQGLFDGDRFFVDLDGDGETRSHGEDEESFPYGRYTRIAGQWFSIVASADGSRVEIACADPPLGKVEVPQRISRASLFSDTQPLYLKFVAGEDSAVAGTYTVHSVALYGGDRWQLPGAYSENRPTVTIREGETTRLVVGEPLKVEAAAVAKDEEGTIDFSLVITGIGGERYRWRKRPGAPPRPSLTDSILRFLSGTSDGRPGFEIVDQDGQVIARQQFEYG
jgi:hypothetical protein